MKRQPTIVRVTKKCRSSLLAFFLLLGFTTGTIYFTSNMTIKAEQVSNLMLSSPITEIDNSMISGKKVTWDCIYFGNYPQKEITSEDSEYAVLTKLSESFWDENGDVSIDGVRYRRMKKSDAIFATSGSSYYYDWSDSNTYHYFKYEPIKWRILKIEDELALLLSDIVLDSQRYHEVDGDITWQNSTIRSWLNGYVSSNNSCGINYGTGKNFIDTAFTNTEQSSIVYSFVYNNKNIIGNNNGGANTLDKLFLLADNEVHDTYEAEKYGFSVSYTIEDEARRCQSSDYAKAMGLFSSKWPGMGDYCWWWLRSPGEQLYLASDVSSLGGLVQDAKNSIGNGVRVALRLKISNTDSYSYAGTVCSSNKVVTSDDEMDVNSNPSRTIYLHYNANGGNGALDSSRVVVTPNMYSSFTITNIHPNRKGYEFLGWSENRYNTTADYTYGNMLSVSYDSEDITLYAIWKKNAVYVLKAPNVSQKNISVKKVQLSWKKVSNAQAYRIYQSTGKTYKLISTTSKLSYTSSNLSYGKKYYYKIVPIRISGEYKSTGTVKRIYLNGKPGKPVLLSYGNKGHLYYVKFKTKKDATHYEFKFNKTKVTMKTKKSATQIIKVVPTSIHKNIIQFRTYNIVNGKKIYSSWSKKIRF